MRTLLGPGLARLPTCPRTSKWEAERSLFLGGNNASVLGNEDGQVGKAVEAVIH